MISKKEINQANWLLQEMMFTASKSNRAAGKMDADEFTAQYMTLLAYVNVMRAYHRVSVRVITEITGEVNGTDLCTVKAFRIDGADIEVHKHYDNRDKAERTLYTELMYRKA